MFLRKLLFTLIAILVLIVGGGTAYLAASGKMAHITGQHGTTSQVAATNGTTPNQNNEQSTNNVQNPNNQTEQAAQNNQNQMNMNMPDNTGQSTQNDSQEQNPGNQTQGNGEQSQVTAQAPGNQAQAPVQTLPPAPPIKLIDPQPYYEKLNKAQETIDEANKMITVDPFSPDSSKDGSMSAPDMAKLHQGIYKMSQGVTAMKETLDSLNGEIKGQTQTQFGVNPYQQYQNQNNQGYAYAVPYNAYGAPNYNYPQNPNYPQNYNYPNNNNAQANGTNQSPNPQAPVQQGQSGANSQQGNITQPSNQEGNTQNSTMPGMNTPGTTDPNSAHSSSQHLTTTPALGSSLDSGNIVRIALYVVLIGSLIAVFASIFGILKGLFQPPANQQTGGTTNV